MPPSYVACVATLGSCPLQDSCLRSKVLHDTDYAARNGGTCLTVVNLWNTALNPQTEQCTMYRKAEIKRFARGFKHLFDNVPKGIYPEVRARVKKVFRSEREYYYCKNGTYLTSEEEQARIAQIFRDHGLTDPHYDALTDVYDWS